MNNKYIWYKKYEIRIFKNIYKFRNSNWIIFIINGIVLYKVYFFIKVFLYYCILKFKCENI